MRGFLAGVLLGTTATAALVFAPCISKGGHLLMEHVGGALVGETEYGATGHTTDAICLYEKLRRRDDANLEQCRPALARDEKPVGRRIVGNAVQHIV